MSEFIDKASQLKVEDGYDTSTQTLIQLSVKIKDLELRIKKLEEVTK